MTWEAREEPDHPGVWYVSADKFRIIGSALAESEAKLIAAAPKFKAACEMMLDFYHLETNAFVAKHGRGVCTRDLGDLARAALSQLEPSK